MSWPICEFPGCTANHIDGTFCKRHQRIARPKETTMIHIDLLRPIGSPAYVITTSRETKARHLLDDAGKEEHDARMNSDGKQLAGWMYRSLPSGTLDACIRELLQLDSPTLISVIQEEYAD